MKSKPSVFRLWWMFLVSVVSLVSWFYAFWLALHVKNYAEATFWMAVSISFDLDLLYFGLKYKVE